MVPFFEISGNKIFDLLARNGDFLKLLKEFIIPLNIEMEF